MWSNFKEENEEGKKIILSAPSHRCCCFRSPGSPWTHERARGQAKIPTDRVSSGVLSQSSCGAPRPQGGESASGRQPQHQNRW